MQRVRRIPDGDSTRAIAAFDRGATEAVEALSRPVSAAFDATLVQRMVDHVIEREWGESEMDAWLAPRVHAVLRIPRRIASDRGVWCWLAMTMFRRYVEYRFPRKPDDPWWRYNGDLLRNAVSRLWWGAEMVRSGPDYKLVPLAFRTVRTFMFVSELRYSWYREAARAFTRVAAGSPPLSDDAIQELSKLFNMYLALDLLESHGNGSASGGADWDLAWGEQSPTWTELTANVDVLVGPSTGVSDQLREDALVEWLNRLVKQLREGERRAALNEA